MDFTESVKTCFRKYFDFSGRAMRSEFWWFQLFMLIVGFCLGVIDALFFGPAVNSNPTEDIIITGNIGYSFFEEGILANLFDLLTIIPSLSVSARRLHDIGKSGWWQTIPLVGFLVMSPGLYLVFVGESSAHGMVSLMVGGLMMLMLFVMLIVWYARDSEHGRNRFGESPKYGSISETFD